MKILAIDIGGTFIKYALMTEDTKIESRGKIPTPTESREALIEAIGKIYDENPQAGGIAISMPGIIDSANGYCLMGGALRYNDDFYLRHALHQRCPLPITIENDAKCAAMAEARLGSIKDVEDGFVLIFGTMIGGAFIQNHKLYKGKHFSAGEISYIVTERDGMPVYETVFGNRCGTPRLCRMYAQVKNLDPASVDGIRVFHDVDAGDKEARECLKRYTREIAVRIFNIQTTLDVERIAIGGGISAAPAFVESIRVLYAVCPYQVPQADVVTCKFQNDANLIGAMQCFLAESEEKADEAV